MLFITIIKSNLIYTMGIGDWGLGIGDWAQAQIPNPQSPIPIVLRIIVYFEYIIIINSQLVYNIK